MANATDSIRVEKNIYMRYGGESFQVKMSHGDHRINKTFNSIEQAKAFRDGINYRSATDVVSQAIYKSVIDRQKAAAFTLGKAFDHYKNEFSEKKRGAESEKSRVNRLREIATKLNLEHKALILVDKADVESILQVVRAGKPKKEGGVARPTSNDNLRRYITILRHLFNVATQKWKMPVINPIMRGDFEIPEANPPRDRRLSEGEWDRLKAAFKRQGATDIYTFALVIVETGMRRGEAMKAVWKNVDLEQRSIYLPANITKTKEARTVGLSIRAVTALQTLTRGIGDAPIFPESITVGRIRSQWLKACKAADIENLRLYDLRHEAISRMAESNKLSALEVQKQAGHKDVRMTLRYVQINSKLVGEKLD